MLVEAATRLFKVDDVELPDPAPNMTVGQVQKFYMDQYPHLATATVDKSEFQGNTLIYTFTQSVGTFG